MVSLTKELAALDQMANLPSVEPYQLDDQIERIRSVILETVFAGSEIDKTAVDGVRNSCRKAFDRLVPAFTPQMHQWGSVK